jgi:transketolase
MTLPIFLVESAHYARLHRQLAHAGPESPAGARLLADLAACNRINALAAIESARHGWIGASFSCAEILTVLYSRALIAAPPGRFSPPTVALGKGHAAPMQYAALAGCGVLPLADLLRYKEPDGPQAHADLRTPGVFMNSGSLGQTLSKACGLALNTAP